MNNERIAEQSTKSLNEGSLTYENCNNEALQPDDQTLEKNVKILAEPH